MSRRRTRIGLHRKGLLAVGAASAAGLLLVGSLPASASTTPRVQQLKIEKLEQEVKQLRLANEDSSGIGAEVRRWAPAVTIFVGIAGVLLAIWKEISNRQAERKTDERLRQSDLDHRSEQLKAEEKQHTEELEQRRIDSQRRFDELFAQAVSDLGSDAISVRLSGVVLLDSLLEHAAGEFVDPVFWVLCANLALEHPPQVNRFLGRSFAKAVRLRLEANSGALPEPLDAKGCAMRGIQLKSTTDHRLNLSAADFAKADLTRANLEGTNLRQMRGYEVTLDRARLSDADLIEAKIHGASARGARFHRATLVSAEFHPSNEQVADLRGAQFFKAKLQSAHFNGADLRGARLEEAEIADADFSKALLDDNTLWSLLQTAPVDGDPGWRRAKFDPDVQAKLAELETNPPQRPKFSRRALTSEEIEALVEKHLSSEGQASDGERSADAEGREETLGAADEAEAHSGDS